MLNAVWLALVLASVAVAAWNGQMEAVSKASLESATSAIELVIGLTGAMVLLLGLVRVASDGGLLRVFVRLLRPLLRRLFPEVPPDHPAMGAILMNFASNMMGLGNAATPFGVKAMTELDRLNPHKGVATNAMAVFLAVNTSSIVVMPPTGTVAVRLAAGSDFPFAIWLPTVFATLCSTVAALTAVLLLGRLPFFRPRRRPEYEAEAEREDEGSAASGLPEPEMPESMERAPEPMGPWRRALVWGFLGLVAAGFAREAWGILGDEGPLGVLQALVRSWVLPLLVVGLVLIGVAGRVRVYDRLVEGGREGLDVAVRIAPFLVAILVAVGMFRASGALDLLLAGLAPLASAIGAPTEVLPMALLRPLTGSGAFGVMADTLEAHGADSFVGLVTSTLQGSTETTFYVLAVYLGAARVRDARHILPACLIGDLAGFFGALGACYFVFEGTGL